MSMKFMKYCRIAILAIGIFVLLQACSSNKVALVYEENVYGAPLEVPPDLTKPRSQDDLSRLFEDDKPASFSKGQSEGEPADLPVLPEQKDIRLERDGAQRWLVLQGEPRNVWPWVREFWSKSSFTISTEDPVMGLIETDWKQYRKNLPTEDGKIVGQVKDEAKVYSVPTRERFRVRLEHGDQPGTTELYLTHRGVSLIADGNMIVWTMRPSDPELEAEVLHNLMMFIGVGVKRSGATLAGYAEHLKIASIIQDPDGHPVLKIDMELSRSWRRIGVILDRMNFIIEDQDRSVGTYKIKSKDPLDDDGVKQEKGWFSSLFSSDDELTNLKVVLKEEGSTTHVTVRYKNGKFASEKVATNVLNEMINQLQ